MDAELLRTIAKFADASPGMRANDYIGSTAYALGAGDDANVPASQVFKHSILPYMISSGVGMGLGTAAGYALPSALEAGGIITPADPVGDAVADLRDKGVDTSGVKVPTAPAAVAHPDTWYRPDHPLIDKDWSDTIRDRSMLAGGFLGTAMGQNAGRKEQFMHGVRDAMEARSPGQVPWDSGNVGAPTQNVPWKTQS